MLPLRSQSLQYVLLDAFQKKLNNPCTRQKEHPVKCVNRKEVTFLKGTFMGIVKSPAF